MSYFLFTLERRTFLKIPKMNAQAYIYAYIYIYLITQFSPKWNIFPESFQLDACKIVDTKRSSKISFRLFAAIDYVWVNVVDAKSGKQPTRNSTVKADILGIFHGNFIDKSWYILQLQWVITNILRFCSNNKTRI